MPVKPLGAHVLAGGDLDASQRVVTINGRAVSAVVFDDDARLTDQRVPTAASVTAAKIAAALKPSGSAATSDEALRALGTAAGTAAAGNDARFVTLQALSADVGPITAQTVLQNITGLGLAIGNSATEIWVMDLTLAVFSANATMKAKFGFTVPAGCTMLWGGFIGTSTAQGGWGQTAVSNTPLGLLTESQTMPQGSAANANFGVLARAFIYGGGTAGTVQAQYAQVNSDAGALKVLKGSYMQARKMVA
jgi:hypothetical protein